MTPGISDFSAYVDNITPGIIDFSAYVDNMTSGITDSGTYANNMRPALGVFERLPKLTHTIRYRTFLFPFSSRYARRGKGRRRGELGLTRKKKRAEAEKPRQEVNLTKYPLGKSGYFWRRKQKNQ